MDPQYIVLGILAAREIRQAIEANRQLTEEQIAAIIASNAIRIDAVKIQIQAEMAKYGVTL